MADETKPETPAPKVVPQTGEATAAAAASTRAPAAGATASAPATGANPAATPHTTTTPAARPAPAPGPAAAAGAHAAAGAPRPAAPPRPPAAPLPDLAGKTTSVASTGGAAVKPAPAPAAAKATTRDADDTSPLLNRRAWMGLGWGARGDRPLHVPQRAERAAAAVQGRLPERIRHGGRRALEREIRGLAGADDRRHRAARQRLLFAQRHLHAPRLHAELPVGGEQVQVPLPRQRLPHDRRELRGAGAATPRADPNRPRGRRADPGRQEPPLPARAGAVDGSGSVPEGVILQGGARSAPTRAHS